MSIYNQSISNSFLIHPFSLYPSIMQILLNRNFYHRCWLMPTRMEKKDLSIWCLLSFSCLPKFQAGAPLSTFWWIKTPRLFFGCWLAAVGCWRLRLLSFITCTMTPSAVVDLIFTLLDSEAIAELPKFYQNTLLIIIHCIIFQNCIILSNF